MHKRIKVALKESTNPHFKSKFANLESVWDACREQLQESKLAVIQTFNIVDGKSCLDTILLHTSGEWLMGTQLLNEIKQDPQASASASTYARRYGLAAILGIIQTDDDAEQAMGRGQQNVIGHKEAVNSVNIEEKANEAAFKFSSSKTLKEAMDNWSKYVAPIYQSLDKDKQAAFERAKEKLKGELK